MKPGMKLEENTDHQRDLLKVGYKLCSELPRGHSKEGHESLQHRDSSIEIEFSLATKG